MKRIPLTHGKVALVDDRDYKRVSQFRWRARRDRNANETWYAETGSTKGGDFIFMHNFILGNDPKIETDHKNGDGLDNQRHNIRPATRSQNCMNRKGWSKHGYKGVYKVTNWHKYGARIQVDGRMLQLGCFDTAEAAAVAYDEAAARYHRDFAKFNFPRAA